GGGGGGEGFRDTWGVSGACRQGVPGYRCDHRLGDDIHSPTLSIPQLPPSWALVPGGNWEGLYLSWQLVQISTSSPVRGRIASVKRTWSRGMPSLLTTSFSAQPWGGPELPTSMRPVA